MLRSSANLDEKNGHLEGEISGLVHFPSPPNQQGRDVLAEPLVRAALLCDRPIALNPATASALLQGVKRSRRGYLIFNPVAGQGAPEQELAEIRSYLEPQFMLQVWTTRPDLDPGEHVFRKKNLNCRVCCISESCSD